MYPTRRTLQRFRDLEGRTLFFAVYMGSRSRGWRSFRPGEVPEFEGEEATFEVTTLKGKWVFGRRVEGC